MERKRVPSKSFLRSQALWIAAFVSSGAQAATYNIYFNNAEQGNNSTAKPTVVVEDSKGAKAQPDQNQQAQQQQAPQGALPAKEDDETPKPASAPSSTTDASLSHREGFGRFLNDGWKYRIMAAGAYNSIHAEEPRGVFDSDPSSSLPFWEQKRDNSSEGAAPQVEGTVFFHPNFGASLIVGRMIGVEGSVLPLGTQSESILQPEISVGLMSMPSSFSASSGPTVGAKLSLSFTPSLALVLGGRSTVLRKSEFNFVQGSLGLAYIF
jgi:hypothetical protein